MIFFFWGGAFRMAGSSDVCLQQNTDTSGGEVWKKEKKSNLTMKLRRD